MQSDNDIDSDNLCADEGGCPFDSETDIDSDGICDNEDTCRYDPFNAASLQ